jgi:hypothetical protein
LETVSIGFQSLFAAPFGMVGALVFGWWDISDRLQDSLVVEPVVPLQGGVFDVVESVQWSASVDDLGLVEAVDRLGHCAVASVAYDELLFVGVNGVVRA